MTHCFKTNVYNAVLDSLREYPLSDDTSKALCNIASCHEVCEIFKHLCEYNHCKMFKEYVKGKTPFDLIIKTEDQANKWMKAHSNRHKLVSLLDQESSFLLFGDGNKESFGKHFFATTTPQDMYDDFLLYTKGAFRNVNWENVWVTGDLVSLLMTNKIDTSMNYTFSPHTIVVNVIGEKAEDRQSTLATLSTTIMDNMNGSVMYNNGFKTVIVGDRFHPIELVDSGKKSIGDVLFFIDLSMSAVAISFDVYRCMYVKAMPCFLKTILTKQVTVNGNYHLNFISAQRFLIAFGNGHTLRHLGTDDRFEVVDYKHTVATGLSTIPLTELNKGCEYMSKVMRILYSVYNVDRLCMSDEEYDDEVKKAFGKHYKRVGFTPRIKSVTSPQST